MMIDDFIKKFDRRIRAFAGVVSTDASPLPQPLVGRYSNNPVFDSMQSAIDAQPGIPLAKITSTAHVEAETVHWSAKEMRHAARLMRVNHVGEICAQALYKAQKRATQSESLRALFEKAANEEEDHLNWTAMRLQQLGTRTSLLNPFWYSGAFAIGLLAGVWGSRFSLGMMAETERQVEQHLAAHIKQWPAHDHISLALLERMLADEVAHGKTALHAGGMSFAWPLRFLMCVAARVMTSTAYYI